MVNYLGLFLSSGACWFVGSASVHAGIRRPATEGRMRRADLGTCRPLHALSTYYVIRDAASAPSPRSRVADPYPVPWNDPRTDGMCEGLPSSSILED